MPPQMFSSLVLPVLRAYALNFYTLNIDYFLSINFLSSIHAGLSGRLSPADIHKCQHTGMQHRLYA